MFTGRRSDQKKGKVTVAEIHAKSLSLLCCTALKNSHSLKESQRTKHPMDALSDNVENTIEPSAHGAPTSHLNECVMKDTSGANIIQLSPWASRPLSVIQNYQPLAIATENKSSCVPSNAPNVSH